MKFWDTITGNDLTREFNSFEARANSLPREYQQAWAAIMTSLVPHGSFTGRNLVPILDDTLGLLEETAAEGQTAREVLGDDIPAFCAALIGAEGAASYRDRWRKQLNGNVARKLDRLGA